MKEERGERGDEEEGDGLDRRDDRDEDARAYVALPSGESAE